MTLRVPRTGEKTGANHLAQAVTATMIATVLGLRSPNHARLRDQRHRAIGTVNPPLDVTPPRTAIIAVLTRIHTGTRNHPHRRHRVVAVAEAEAEAGVDL